MIQLLQTTFQTIIPILIIGIIINVTITMSHTLDTNNTKSPNIDWYSVNIKCLVTLIHLSLITFYVTILTHILLITWYKCTESRCIQRICAFLKNLWHHFFLWFSRVFLRTNILEVNVVQDASEEIAQFYRSLTAYVEEERLNQSVQLPNESENELED